MASEPKRQATGDELALQIMRKMQREDGDYRPRKSSGSGKKKKKRRTSKKPTSALHTALVTILLLLAIIIAVGVYLYLRGLKDSQDKFLRNTFINSVDVSGMTEAEAYAAVSDSEPAPAEMELIKLDGGSIKIPLADIGYVDNVKISISQFLTQQNRYLWFRSLYKKTEYNFTEATSYDNEKLTAVIKERVIDKSGKNPPKDAYINYTPDGFEIHKEVKGDKIDETKTDKLMDYIRQYLDNGVYVIDLAAADVYQLPKVLATDLEEEYRNMGSIYDVVISINFGYESAQLTGAEFLDWLIFDQNNANNSYKVDTTKVEAYVEQLAYKYDTFGTTRIFETTNKGEKRIEQGKGDYGWWIDKDETRDLIIDTIKKGKSAEIDPIYYTNPDSNYTYACNPRARTANSDIGTTYCEVDLSAQHFWYYYKGELKYECDIVSGVKSKTPAGIYKIWDKQMDKVLEDTNDEGESWSTPVTYWTNISTFGVGIHDSKKRTAFGGTIYKKYGSQGCINMTVQDARYVYENISLNTPVIMYWD
ncbi:MAG: peptidoglycan binding domain-containing protein [Ruminococcus sp.]|nr:peptidoglycan binding domain-containing protein [Ruminococcus sp.]